MKLTSKEICPTGQDVALCLVKALKEAENECFELDKELAHATKKISELKKENEELEQYVAHVKNLINDLREENKKLTNE